MAPRFSVVVPVQNRAERISRTVASLLAQTFSDIEVVVVDQGSDDETVAAVRAVADRRVHVIAAGRDDARRPDTRWPGVAPPLAQGIRAAEGSRVVVIPTDVEIHPTWLARCGREIERTGADILTCGPRGWPVLTRRRSVVAALDRLQPSLAGVDDCSRWARDPANLFEADARRCVSHLDECLVEPAEVTPPLQLHGDELRLHWARQAVEVVTASPIPDVDLLARCATRGGVAAARLRRHAEARDMFDIARRVQPRELKPLARWVVSGVPSLADRVWDPAEAVAAERSRTAREQLLGPQAL